MSMAPAEAQRPMHIVWVVDGVEGSEEQGYRSRLASNRYRAILPAQAMREKGHRVTFVSAKDWRWQPENAPDVVVVGKLLAGRDAARYRDVSEQVLKQVGAAVQAGTPVIADFNDDHFDHPQMGGYWRQLARLATVCVAGSDAMAQLLARHTQRPTRVVGDPIASPPGEPRVFRAATGLQRLVSRLLPGSGQQRLKLVWYGNTVNWPAMQRWAQELAPLSQTQPFVLWLVTSPTEAVQSFVRDFNARHAPAALAELIEWDEQTQWDVVRDADIVLLPSDPSDPKKNVKTSNRLVDALHAGRFVVASPLPAYQEFSETVALTEAPISALFNMIERPDEILERISQGQKIVKKELSKESIGARWLEVFVEGVQKSIGCSVPQTHSTSEGGSKAGLKVFQIFYDAKSRFNLDGAFIPLDNSTDMGRDWYEFQAINALLESNSFKENDYLGVLSPRFQEKTGMVGDDVFRVMSSTNADVVSFSPKFEAGVLYVNTFHQGEFRHPGFLRVVYEVFGEIGLSISTIDAVHDQTRCIFSNYFVARYSFWRIWHHFALQIVNLSESGRLKVVLNSYCAHRGRRDSYKMKIFLMERLVSAVMDHLNIGAEVGVDFEKYVSSQKINPALFDELLVLDSLKSQSVKTGRIEYLRVYEERRGRIIERFGVDAAVSSSLTTSFC